MILFGAAEDFLALHGSVPSPFTELVPSAGLILYCQMKQVGPKSEPERLIWIGIFLAQLF